MPYRSTNDLISQTELRKGAEFMTGTSSAVRVLRELYFDALERRIAAGAHIEPGALGFVQQVGIVSARKQSGKETQVVADQAFSRVS